MRANLGTFSVLIPVYLKDSHIYFARALQSVVRQTLVPQQIVIVVDGPIGYDLETTIENFRRSISWSKIEVTIVSNDTNQGLGVTLNIGLENCKYAIVARADADDVNQPNRFELEYKRIMENNEVSIVGSDVEEFISDEDNVVSRKRMPMQPKEILKFSRYRNPFNHPSVMFKKEVILRVGSYRDIKFLEDYDLWMRVLEENNVSYVNINEPLVKMRINGQSERRGGLRYTVTYLKLKRNFFRRRNINFFEFITGCAMVIANGLLPSKVRGVLVSKILR